MLRAKNMVKVSQNLYGYNVKLRRSQPQTYVLKEQTFYKVLWVQITKFVMFLMTLALK